MNNAPTGMGMGMMEGMGGMMMWGMGLIWLLVIVLLILGIAALVKNLFGGSRR
ncbi:hypothetical protein [Oceanibaculum indicum]|uniref:hypothetical protein n=1 Tax=Oceanibaculum indicum TaxID=526216 RepID=UPI000303CA8B|nr:hypothetical protein [Oceanibaculum indicum]